MLPNISFDLILMLTIFSFVCDIFLILTIAFLFRYDPRTGYKH